MLQKGIRDLLRVTTHILKYDNEIPVTRLQVLLLIARNSRNKDGQGLLVRDIVKHTGLNQSTIARSLGLLGEKTVRGQKDPLRWVELIDDYEDPRRKRCLLTPKGEQVIREINELLG